jgi:transposase
VHWGSLSESGAVRDKDQQSDNLFSYIRLETRIQADHPLRPIRRLIDETLRELSAAFYAREGRPSIPPERLLRTVLLQAFCTVGLLMEQLDYNHLFCWFVGPSMDDAVWDATVFCKNRDRLPHGYIAPEFMTFSASR